MNILQLSKYYDPINGGIELVARLVTHAFRDEGHDVTVVAFSHQPKKRTGRYGETIIEIEKNLSLLSTPMNFNFLFALKDLLQKKKFDRIYVHLPNPFMHEAIRMYRSVLKASGTRVVGIYHSDIVNKNFFGTVYQNYFYHSHFLYDEIICSSPNLISSSSTLSRIPKKKMKVIPFCVEEGGKYVERKKFTGELLTIGRMVPYKGYEFLIRAINQSPYKLKIIGGGPLLKSLKKIAGPNITFMGNISDQEKEDLIVGADALIVSSISRAEAYGMTIVEAFQKGLPVIASSIDTGVTFLVKDGQTGLTFGIRNRQELLGKLSKLASDPSLLNVLSKNGHAFYQNEIRYDLFREKILN